MKKYVVFLAVVPFLFFLISPAFAAISLYDWAFNIDGGISENFGGDPFPSIGTLDSSGFGTLSWSTNVAGTHNFDAFFDFEIDEPANTFFNESGVAVGTVAAEQSWEIDEPGYVFGDIYDNLLASTLDNSNGVPAGLEDDVSFALGWDFTLAAGETAFLNYVLSDIVPNTDFYLSHTDPDSQASLFFSSSLVIRDGNVPIPEPSTLLLFGSSLAGLGFYLRKRRAR